MIKFLLHLFFPNAKNNHRAKILHNSSLFLIIIFLFGITYFAQFIKTSYPDILGVSYSISETDLLIRVNKERENKDLPPLVSSAELSNAARRKAADMYSKNYWAHFAPDGSTSPWQFIRTSGYNYQFAGENLAKGFTDSDSIVSAWMNSPTHRDNILSSHYEDIGFAIVPGSLKGEETVLVVEMFGRRTSDTLGEASQATVASTQSQVKIASVDSSQALSVQNITNNPKVNAATTTRAASTVGLSFLVFGFLMDALIVERKKIPRIVGHNIDHVILILCFLFFIVLVRGGIIL